MNLKGGFGSIKECLKNRNKWDKTSRETKMASAVALFGMLLKKSSHVQQGGYAEVLSLAQQAKGSDKFGYRNEFIELVKKAQRLSGITKELAEAQ